MNSVVKGEAARQAVDCLGGYAYQIYASALAWATLSEGEVLHLEVAEDFAVSTKSALNAVQVKRTAGKVTSNSAGIIAAIDSFVTLTLANPLHEVSLRYLTTSEIGTEKRKEDRVSGDAFITAWSKLRTSGDLAPLRSRLATVGLAEQTIDYISELNDADLRKRVIRKLWFDCGQPGFDILSKQLDDALVEVGATRGVFSVDSENTRPAIIEQVLLRSCETGSRQLLRSDFLRAFDKQNTVSVSAVLLQSIIGQVGLNGDQAQTTLGAICPVVEPLTGNPEFANQAPRDAILLSLSKRHDGGPLWLHAGTGYGKTHLAKTLVSRSGAKGGILRLRDLSAQQMVAALGRARSEMLFTDYGTVIIDDVGNFETEAVASAIRRLVEQSATRQQSLIFTSYHRPSETALAALGLLSSSCAEISGLTDVDLLAMVKAAPSNADVWVKYVRFGSSNGHPQLSHALVEGLRRRDWPRDDLTNMSALLGSDDAINRTKDEIRRRLLLELPDDMRVLTYRLSLITSAFDDHLIKAVAEVPLALSNPGELLDLLIGPWIDRLGNDQFQLSPLLSGIGSAQLNKADQRGVHAAIAGALIQNNTIDSRRLDQLLVSGLASEAEGPLLAFVMATLGTDIEKIPLLASNCITLGLLRTDRPILPTNRRLSLQLRIIQALFCLSESSKVKFAEVLQAFNNEIKKFDDDKGVAILRLALNGKMLLMPQLAEMHPTFPALIVEAMGAAKTLGISSEYDFPGDEDGYAGVTLGMGPAFFIQQMTGLKRLESLELVLESLAGLETSERNSLVPPHDSIRFNPEQIVKAIWIKEKNDTGYSSVDFSSKCLNFARRFAVLGEREFAIGAYVCAAVIVSEEMDKQDEALVILNQAEREFGPDFALSRGKAGVFFTTKQYQRQLETIEPVLPTMADEGWIERTYLFRETAIAHGNLEDWENCFKRFDQARIYASKAKIEQMTLMEIGLQADSAVALWKGGDTVAGVETINAALTRLEGIDPSAGFRQRALHRLVKFAGFWMYSEYKNLRAKIADVDAEMVIGCCSNPNPHAGLDEMPIGPVKMIKYLLAQIDIGNDYAAGIWRNEVSRFSDEEAVLPLECTLYVEAFREAVKSGAETRIVEFGPLCIDAMFAIGNGAIGRADSDGFQIGRLPIAPPEEWFERRANLANQLAVYMLNSVASQKQNSIDNFLALVGESERPLIEPDEIKCLQDAIPQASNATQSVFGAVGAFRKHLAEGVRPPMPSLFVTTLRILDAMRMSDGFVMCEEFVVNWAFQMWGQSIREERFRLSTPALAERDIYPALDNPERDLPSLASLVLSIAPYVGVRLSRIHADQLRQLSQTVSS
jgi:hypothetical protein